MRLSTSILKEFKCNKAPALDQIFASTLVGKMA
jgi:hypothetical protein